MNAQELRIILFNKGWLTIENIMASNEVGVYGVEAKEISSLLKSLAVQGKLDVKAGIASGPRMYRLRRTPNV